MAVLQYRYQYRSAMGAESLLLLPLLQQAQKLAPGDSWSYYYLLYEYAQVPDAASMYNYARLWLLHDRNRYNIHQLKALFVLSDKAKSLSHE